MLSTQNFVPICCLTFINLIEPLLHTSPNVCPSISQRTTAALSSALSSHPAALKLELDHAFFSPLLHAVMDSPNVSLQPSLPSQLHNLSSTLLAYTVLLGSPALLVQIEKTDRKRERAHLLRSAIVSRMKSRLSPTSPLLQPLSNVSFVHVSSTAVRW